MSTIVELLASQAIHKHQLNAQSNGNVTVSIVNPAGIQCENPDRPAEIGDVYSVHPDGRITARPAGTNGPYELAKVAGPRLVFAPKGAQGAAYVLPYVTEIPNV